MQYDMTDQMANEQPPHDNSPHEQRHLSNATDVSGSGTQRTSSLERTDTNRSMTPPDGSSAGSIKYTRTGRISKAAKGQRIHHCDECGKTYTRAEHLRRHQQNHKPGAFPCDVEGCGRSFYREDLLTRHKIRHNDPMNPPSRRQSQASQSSNPNMGGSAPGPAPGPAHPRGYVPAFDPNLTSPYEPSGPSVGNAQQHNTSPRPPKRLPVPPNELCGGTPIEIGGQPIFVRLDSWSETFRQTPLVNDYDYNDDYEYPNDTLTSAQLTAHMPRPRHAPGISMHRRTTRVPWSRDLVSELVFRPLGNSASCGRSSLRWADSRHTRSMRPSDRLCTARIAERDSRERKELSAPECGSKTGLVAEVANAARKQSCVLAYWSRIPDIVPVLSAASFRFHRASPLLRAAILAVGEQAIRGSRNRLSADRRHARCLRVLHQRTLQGLHTYRLDDMLAIILIELYARLTSG